MAQVSGYITVYETSDGGSGDPAKSVWQFFVGAQPVSTENHRLAKTMRLAVETASKVRVTYDQQTTTMSQARIEFKYVCERRKVDPCDSPEPVYQCETRRYSKCDSTDDRPDDGAG